MSATFATPAADALSAEIARGAAIFAAQPWRVAYLWTGAETLSPDTLRECLDERIPAMASLGARGHWAYDFNKHLALLQARAALDLPAVSLAAAE